MKSQVLTLLLLTISAHLFQSTYQYRLQKRELTEYDLTNFIVTSCSANKVDVYIKNLCDQTLQSALLGNFPFLTYYCKAVGSGNRYCDTINRYTLAEQNVRVKRFVRSSNDENTSSRNEQDTSRDMDLEHKLIVQICMTNTEKNSIETHRFCNHTLKRIQQGQDLVITRFCQSHPELTDCRDVLAFSSFNSWRSSSRLSSLPSLTSDTHLTSVPLESSDINKSPVLSY